MKPTTSDLKLTYEDLLQLPEDGLRHELIDGEHYVSAAPNLRHQLVVGRLFLSIGNWLEVHPVGRVLFAPFDVVLSDFDVVEPDLLYFSHERAKSILTPARAMGPPELVIEVFSPSTRKRDETLKKRLYERSGADEYWCFDPEIDVARIYRRTAGVFAPVVELSAEAGHLLTTPLFPGLELRLNDIFRE